MVLLFLWGQFIATTVLSFTASPTVNEALFIRAAIELGPFQHTSGEGPSPSTRVPQGKTLYPNPFPTPQGVSPGCLQEPGCRCCFGYFATL